MKVRTISYSIIFGTLLIICSELLSRLALIFFGYPFFQPYKYIYKQFYKNLEVVAEKNISSKDDVVDVLILGGSVISTPWSGMESRLDTLLKKAYKGKVKFAFYNVATAGHTSLDNLLKYRLLEKQRFDLVIYYEAINENRANNINPGDFRSDYSHINWYNDIHRFQNHPEINYTVIPYLLDIIFGKVYDKITHKVYISQENVDPRYVQYGNDIKTAVSYKNNLTEIIKIAKKRGDKLLLLTYASYFPENVTLGGKEGDSKYFAGCRYASPVNIWGRPANVKKGIAIHNQILKKLAIQSGTEYFDLARRMPADHSLFCDICHLSEPGAQYFARELAAFIVREKLIE